MKQQPRSDVGSGTVGCLGRHLGWWVGVEPAAAAVEALAAEPVWRLGAGDLVGVAG